MAEDVQSIPTRRAEPVKRKPFLAVALTLAVAGALVACSANGGDGGEATTAPPADGGGGTDATCTNTITKTDLPVVTMWAWYPNMDLAIDNFNEANDEVQVCWTNVGQGGDEYEKFQTAIAAGTGAPDVVMVEADRILNFQIQGALSDISPYVTPDIKANFSDGAWKDVSVGDAIYGAPIDGGPVAMIYRQDIFEEYGLEIPTTWAEYEATARQLKDAGGPLFGDVGANNPALLMALQIQRGAEPFVYDPKTPEQIGINLNDQASKDVMEYWGRLAAEGLVGTDDQFTPEYIAGVIGGDYATYVSAAWAPGYLQGAGVGQEEDAGAWRTAPLPQWSAGDNVQVNWGGSAFSVSSQASNVELAAKVALGVYADEATLTDGWVNQIIFPLNQNVLNSAAFNDLESEFFGGQQANKEVYSPAAAAYGGTAYSPFGQVYLDTLQEHTANVSDGTETASDALDAVQATVVAYAQEQGFTVIE